MRRGPMRRIVMFNWLTTDGYFSGPDGNLDWVVPDEEQAKAAARDIASCDTVLFGRRTYERFERFWARGRQRLHRAGPPPPRTTIPGTPDDCGGIERDDQGGLLQDSEGRHVE